VDLGAESARALTQVGDIQRKLGRLPDSIASYRKALDAFRSLGSETGASDLTLEQAKILNAIATTQSRAGIIREAFGTYREARQLLQGDPAADRADFRFELARNLVLVATVGERTGMRHEDSSDVGERGDRRGRGRPGRRGANGRSAHLDSAGEAIEILTGMLGQDPERPEYRFLLVRAHRARVPTAAGEEEPTGEESALSAAIREADRLVREFPETPAFHYELADTLTTRLEGDETFAARIDRAAGISLDLVRRHPDMPEFQDLAGRCLAGKGGQLAEDGELSAAVHEFERALNHLRPGADRFPSVLSLQRSCAEALASLAEVRVRLGDRAAATALLDEAIRRAEAFRDRRTTTRPVLATLLVELRRMRDSLRDR
jgi:tetratricopeptide (TPR) repeat protein